MLVTTKRGQVLGQKRNHLYAFEGIIYATAKRFEAPQPYFWEGVLECLNYRKRCPQIDKGKILPETYSEKECLNLNVYTPNVSASLPVLVEIHGGAFQNGSNQKMDAMHIIQDEQIVYVSINYRLGVFGYLYLGDSYPTSGNNGTLDQLAALKWVQENIHYFGGNPKKVTVLGSSAGAKSVAALMGCKDASELFSQAILVSGAYQSVRDTKTAKVITDRYFEILKRKDISQLSTETLLKAQNVLCQGAGSTCIFGPVSDDIVIPRQFFENMKKGDYWQGKAIIGSSLHEMMFFKLMNKNFVEEIEDICEGLFGKNASIAIEEGKELEKMMNKEDAWIKVVSDYMYRTYSYRMADLLSKNGNVIYQYTTRIAPAMHTLDHTLSLEPRAKLQRYYANAENIEEIIQLGNVIRQAYLNFVMNGTPKMDGWVSLNTKKIQMIWDLSPYVEEIQNDVCERFPDAVYQL